MEAVVFHAVGDNGLETIPDPKFTDPTDATVRVTPNTSQQGTLADALSAHGSSDDRADGWLKVARAR